MRQEQRRVCPACGAALQENARFCLHCMTQLDEKEKISLPRRSRRTVLRLAVPALCLLLAAGAVLLLFSKTAGKRGGRTPLSDFSTFRTAVILTSERLGCDAFWDVDGFLDVEYDKSSDTQRYTTGLFLSGARLDLFFRGGGDVVTLILSDVPADRLDDAKRLCAAVHAAVTNHYSDILTILTDDGTYHRFDAGTPYVAFFAEMTGRTARYAADLAAGMRFHTCYTLIDDENKTDDDFTVFFETERVSADASLYDLILRFDYYGDDEVVV